LWASASLLHVVHLGRLVFSLAMSTPMKYIHNNYNRQRRRQARKVALRKGDFTGQLGYTCSRFCSAAIALISGYLQWLDAKGRPVRLRKYGHTEAKPPTHRPMHSDRHVRVTCPDTDRSARVSAPFSLGPTSRRHPPSRFAFCISVLASGVDDAFLRLVNGAT
jgi:hypothetical protein